MWSELLGITDARLLLADFIPYLQGLPQTERFDLAIASGVLYHMRDPLQLLELLTARADDIVLWTHVYDEQVIRSRPELSVKFTHTNQLTWRGQQWTLHRQDYQAALTRAGFCGGPAEWSCWLTRDDLFTALDVLGLRRRGHRLRAGRPSERPGSGARGSASDSRVHEWCEASSERDCRS